tara:strand:+ start:783 stop:932 length:150 start_codon:yes stop_codon:yes gene_type:complete
MPGKAKCSVDWKKLGYKSMQDCMSYGSKKMGKKMKKSGSMPARMTKSSY